MLIALATIPELYALAHLFNQIRLHGRYPHNVIFTQLTVNTPHSPMTQPHPRTRLGVAVVHQQFAVLVLDLCVVG